MNRLLLPMILLISFAACTSAQISPSLRVYLSTYIGNAIINSSTFYTQSIGLANYTLMQPNSSYNKFVIINTTLGRYSFVTDNALAYNVISPLLLRTFYPSNTVLNTLNSSISSFKSKSNTNLTQCLFQTGLSYAMCNTSMTLLSCMEASCARVPLCGGVQASPKSALTQFGIPSPFAYGVQNLSYNYQKLNSSYNSFFSLLSNLGTSNYGTSLIGMKAALANIISVSSKIQNNPIFPTPSNITLATLSSTCTKYYNNDGPWWCYAIGYCDSIPFNYSKTGSSSTTINSLLAMPVTSNAIRSVAANSTSLANGYLNKVTTARKTVELNAFLANVLPVYNATLRNASTMNSRINNASLSFALETMTYTFNIIDTAGINQNITQADRTMNSLIANVSALYSSMDAKYGQIYAISANNTRTITAKELDFRSVPGSLAQLASRQAAVNTQLSGRINESDTAAVLKELKSIRSGLGYVFSPISLEAMVKGFDGGFASSMLAGAAIPVQYKLAEGASYAFAFAFVVSVVLLGLFYMLTYRRLLSKNKLHLSPRVRRAWNRLFIALGAIALIISVLTYTYAGSAISFLPFGSFLGALTGSHNVLIAYNSSVNASVHSCVSALSANLQALGKNVTTVALNGYSCVQSNTVSADCLDKALASMKPVVIIGNGGSSSIVYNGMYGTALHATGNAVNGGTCQLGYALKYK